MSNQHKKRWINVTVILLFTITLISFRLLWLQAADNPKDFEVKSGEADISNIDFSDGKIVTLSGEWGFYPYEFITDVIEAEGPEEKIQVPGGWSEALNDGENSYGYGTYHLRLYVGKGNKQAYSMRASSVRSSSKLYSNGLKVGGSGEIGRTQEEGEAFNVPYTSSALRADETGHIDLFLQVANFEDPRTSGLVREVKFGLEEVLVQETELSVILQVTTAVIFMVHAVFALIIFFVGVRDKRLLYFSLLIFILAFVNLSGGDEKVLFHYIPLNYTFSFKFAFALFVILSWSIIQLFRPQIDALHKWFAPIYTLLVLSIIIIIAFLPLDKLAAASNVSFLSIFLATVISAIALIYKKEMMSNSIWLVLSIIAILHHFIWWAIMMWTGVKVVYYPFDLTIAIICIAVVWAHQYYKMHLNLQKQTDKLKEADKEKNEFLATTSHELRNPLHSILNMSQAIVERERGNLKEESLKNMEAVLSVTRRLTLLVNDLLEISNLKDGKLTMRKEPVLIQAVIYGVIDMATYKLEGKNIRIINEIPEDFPFIDADENRLVQIMFNLLHNAIKFTQEGKIVIHAEHDGSQAYISVSDTGVGIAKEEMATLFDAYKQGTAYEYLSEGGFGLGLNICKKLVELHGGRIEVASIVNEGSTFTFTIPLAQVSSNMKHEMKMKTIEEPVMIEKLEEVSNESKSVYRTKHLPRIMVVDDDPINLQTIETVLSAHQYEIVTFISAELALQALDEQEWDLIISDVMMPHMSGYEFTREVRKKYNMTELPILLLTARGRIADIPHAFRLGTNDYVTKPVESDELRARVQALTDVKLSARNRLELESAWLHAQIQPHFIFNTINSIIALSEIDIKRMQQLLEAFSDVLRNKFAFRDLHEFVPIEQEIQLIESYLHIEKERFRDRLTYELEIDPNVDIEIPTLTIQPLVENAVEHGILPRLEGGSLIVRVLDHHTYAEITVTDDGIGIDEETLRQIERKERASKSGVGLYNTNMRLERVYGKGLEIETGKEGTTISFMVPYNLS